MGCQEVGAGLGVPRLGAGGGMEGAVVGDCRDGGVGWVGGAVGLSQGGFASLGGPQDCRAGGVAAPWATRTAWREDARQPDPPVILGVMRTWSGSALASVSLLPPSPPPPPSPGSGVHPLGAGEATVARMAVGMLLGTWLRFIVTLSSPTAWVCGAGGPASCPAAPEHLGVIPMDICTHSQRAQHWDPRAGRAGQASGRGDGC